MLYPLMNVIGPLILIGVLVWAYFYTRKRSRRMDRTTDEATRDLREDINEEDTGQRRAGTDACGQGAAETISASGSTRTIIALP